MSPRPQVLQAFRLFRVLVTFQLSFLPRWTPFLCFNLRAPLQTWSLSLQLLTRESFKSQRLLSIRTTSLTSRSSFFKGSRFSNSLSRVKVRSIHLHSSRLCLCQAPNQLSQLTLSTQTRSNMESSSQTLWSISRHSMSRRSNHSLQVLT
jgi:hypothetical protein